MRKGIYILPNLLTVCGLFFGFYAIVASIKLDFDNAAWAILVASVFDGLDGWVARKTNTTSQFGVELDSLSDLVSFGVAPAVMFYVWALTPFQRYGWAGAFLFVACGALRLARFNVQKVSSEKKWFTGLPIPGGAAVLATTILFYLKTFGQKPYELNYVFIVEIYIVAILMISTVKFHSIKELNMKERKPFWMLTAALILLVLIALDPPRVLFGISIIYVIWNLLESLLTFNSRRAKMKAGV